MTDDVRTGRDREGRAVTDWTPIGRVTAFVEALERAGYGKAIVSCRYGHEAHWPGPTGEYVPLHAGDLRELLDELQEAAATSGPSYADKVDAPLPEATVAALNIELAADNYARYRRIGSAPKEET